LNGTISSYQFKDIFKLPSLQGPLSKSIDEA